MKKRLWKRWYPRSWRTRYGEEYEQLLQDLEADNEMTWRNEINVAQTGLALRRVYPGRRIGLGIGTAAVLIVAVVAFAVGFGVRSSSVPVPSFAIQRCIRVAPSSASSPAAAQARAKALAAAAKAARNAVHVQKLPRGATAIHVSISTACPGGSFRIVSPVAVFPPGRIITPAAVVPPGALSTPASVRVQQPA